MNKEIISADNQPINTIQKNNKVYCSIHPKTIDEKKKLYNALENCDIILNDIVGQKIKVKDIYIQEYPRTDKNTGEAISNGHRVILFDENGKSYVTASNYFFISLIKVINTFGEPNTWEEPIEIEITKRQTKSGFQCLSFKLV